MMPIKVSVNAFRDCCHTLIHTIHTIAAENGYDVQTETHIDGRVTLKINTPIPEVHRITKFSLSRDNFNMPFKLFYSRQDADKYFESMPATLAHIVIWEKLDPNTGTFVEFARK